MNNNSQVTAKSLSADDAYEIIRHQKLEELPKGNHEVKDSFGIIFRGRYIKKATIKTRDATLSLFILNGAGEIDTREASANMGNLRPHIIARGEFVNNQLQGLGIKEQVPTRATNLIPHWITKRSVKWIGNFKDNQLKGLHVKIDTLTHRTFYQVPEEVVEQYSLYYLGIFEKDKLQGPGEIFSIGENNKASIKGVFERGRLVGEVEITYPDGSSEKCDADSEICRNTLDMMDFYNVIRRSTNDVPKIYRPTK